MLFEPNPENPRLAYIYKDPKEIAPDVPFPDTPGDIKNYELKMLGRDDPENPLNMTNLAKGVLLFSLSFVIMVASWGSAIGAPATEVYKQMFHLGLPVATLNVSLYVVGFAIGPVVWGPISGFYGRKVPLFLGSFGLMLFMFACATAKDWQTIVLCRFFQGVFGASSLSVGPSVAGDAFTSHSRGSSLTIVTFCVIAGPMIAPIVGAYITQSFLGWRWTMYITGIMAALASILVVFVLPETYEQTILQRRAKRLRHSTGNWALRAPGELKYTETKALMKEILLGPMIMLCREVILGLISVYHGFIYGILYLCLEAVPIIFAGYQFKGAKLYLPYISLLVGAMAVCAVNLIFFERDYNRALVKYNKPVLPERRLYLMIMVAFFFTIGIFLLCWSGAYHQHVHWIVPCVGGAFVGYGIIGIFLAAFNYILDTYLHLSAMAFAANTFLRSAFGCAFPLFAHPLFINLGIQWAGTLIGCLAAIMIPVPVLFLFYGAKLRSMSPYAVNLEDAADGDAEAGPEDESDTTNEKHIPVGFDNDRVVDAEPNEYGDQPVDGDSFNERYRNAPENTTR